MRVQARAAKDIIPIRQEMVEEKMSCNVRITGNDGGY
jgi:hypothetical protein